MKLFLFSFFISCNLFAQNFTKVDNIVANYPRFSNVESLANKIKIDFDLDADKARAAFFWLAKNIRYNLKEFLNPRERSYSFSYSTEAEKEQKLQALKDNLVKQTFRNKTGVCEEYAQSFKKICDLLGLESAVISGYVRNDAKEIGNIPRDTNHAWNAVKLNNKWILLDVTWAAGYLFNGKWIREFDEYFYDIPTSKIFKTHFPEDSIWVLRFGRISINDFFKQPIYTNSFLRLDTELVSPKKGILIANSSEKIALKFKNLDDKLSLYYTLSGNRYLQKPQIIKTGNITTVFIKNPKRNSELVIYINNTDALHFKIKV